MGWRERTPRLAESSSREDAASRSLRLNSGNAGRVRFLSRRMQPAQSLRGGVLTDCSCRAESAPLENELLAQSLASMLSASGTRFDGSRSVSDCSQKCYDQWGILDYRGKLGTIPGANSQGFPRSKGRFATASGAVTSVCPACSLGCWACGTLPASARVFAD